MGPGGCFSGLKKRKITSHFPGFETCTVQHVSQSIYRLMGSPSNLLNCLALQLITMESIGLLALNIGTQLFPLPTIPSLVS